MRNNTTVSIRNSRTYLINSPFNHRIVLQGHFNTRSVDEMCLNRQFRTRLFVKTATTVVYVNLYHHKIQLSSTVFQHSNIRVDIWISPDWKNKNQVHHTLIDRRWYSGMLDIRKFRIYECDTNNYLGVAIFTESLLVNKSNIIHLYRRLWSQESKVCGS